MQTREKESTCDKETDREKENLRQKVKEKFLVRDSEEVSEREY
jgi:hypothetical protein